MTHDDAVALIGVLMAIIGVLKAIHFAVTIMVGCLIAIAFSLALRPVK